MNLRHIIKSIGAFLWRAIFFPSRLIIRAYVGLRGAVIHLILMVFGAFKRLSAFLIGIIGSVFSKILSWLNLIKNKIFGPSLPSLNFEVTVLYSLILGGILIVFSGMLYAILFQGIYTELDNELEIKAENVSQSIRAYVEVKGKTPEALQFAVEKTVSNEGKRLNRWWMTGFERKWFKTIDAMDLSQNFINFIGSDGASMGKSQNLPEELLKIFLSNALVPPNKGGTFKTIPYYNRNIRLINLPFEFDGIGKSVIQIGVFQQPLMDLIYNWLQSIIYSIPLVLLLTSFIGRVLVKKILRPVEKISVTARNISHEDLSARVKVIKPYVEMNYLVDDFNEMIARLEQAFKHIEEFSSHVAHELKTPLTIIKGETELALYDDRTKEQYKRALKVSVEEVDKMLKIVEELLLLSKLDFQPQMLNFEEIEFIAYFIEIFDQSRILARNKQIKISAGILNEKIAVMADKLHLRRLFFNLIDNALKFTPRKGTVQIKITKDEEYVTIAITDSGPGISKEDIPKVFDRFYRAGTNKSGCGLGLNIAQSIAEIHKGKITIESELNKGTTVTVVLPVFK